MRSGTLLATIVASLLASLGPVTAKPYVLKCTLADGNPISDLLVDLDNQIMQFGPSQNPSRYVISDTTERYITGFYHPTNLSNNIVGEIWVLDRITGDFTRAFIGSPDGII